MEDIKFYSRDWVDELYEKMMEAVCEGSRCMTESYHRDIFNICESFKSLIVKIETDSFMKGKEESINSLRKNCETLKLDYEKLYEENERNKLTIRDYFIPALEKKETEKYDK